MLNENHYHLILFPIGAAQMTALSLFMSRPEALLPRVNSASAAEPVEDALSSERLLKGRREILIRHGDRIYRLRHTSNDKLILTK